MNISSLALEQGQGILRLAPTWVPRSFCIPGRRIKLHPDDYYAMGGERGGIDERWFSSTTAAKNGPLTSPNEGLSFVVFEDGSRTEKFLLRDAVSELKAGLIGERLWNKYQPYWHTKDRNRVDLDPELQKVLTDMVNRTKNESQHRPDSDDVDVSKLDYVTMSRQVWTKKGKYLRFSKEVILKNQDEEMRKAQQASKPPTE